MKVLCVANFGERAKGSRGGQRTVGNRNLSARVKRMAGPVESCRGAIEVDLTRQLHWLFTSAVYGREYFDILIKLS